MGRLRAKTDGIRMKQVVMSRSRIVREAAGGEGVGEGLPARIRLPM